MAGCRCPSSALKTSRGAEVKSRVSTFHLGTCGGLLKHVRYDPEAVASVGALTPMARLGCRMLKNFTYRNIVIQSNSGDPFLFCGMFSLSLSLAVICPLILAAFPGEKSSLFVLFEKRCSAH